MIDEITMKPFRAACRPKTKANLKQDDMILTVGSKTDKQPVRHTYAVNEWSDFDEIISKYLDDCGADYDEEEVEEAAKKLQDKNYAQIGNHFFQLTDVEKP
jgi:hypothetical protein